MDGKEACCGRCAGGRKISEFPSLFGFVTSSLRFEFATSSSRIAGIAIHKWASRQLATGWDAADLWQPCAEAGKSREEMTLSI